MAISLGAENRVFPTMTARFERNLLSSLGLIKILATFFFFSFFHIHTGQNLAWITTQTFVHLSLLHVEFENYVSRTLLRKNWLIFTSYLQWIVLCSLNILLSSLITLQIYVKQLCASYSNFWAYETRKIVHIYNSK